jgi:hypothetical protein
MIPFRKIQAKCPWKDISIWRGEQEVCSVNKDLCSSKNCAIYKAITVQHDRDDQANQDHQHKKPAANKKEELELLTTKT